MKITQRSPVAVIILTIVTFGIYGLYWIVSTKREINGLGASIPTSWLLIIPIANLYYLYKFAEGFSIYVKKDNNAILWFLLWVFVAPVMMIIIQIELNKFATSGGSAIAQPAAN